MYLLCTTLENNMNKEIMSTKFFNNSGENTLLKMNDGLVLSTNCRQLKMQFTKGIFYKTEAIIRESASRIIQSIPSPKTEPFKRWLAKNMEYIDCTQSPCM
jgi:hypothetical protein